MTESEVVRRTHQFLKHQTFHHQSVVRLYTDAHATLLSDKGLQPFQRFFLDLGDMVLHPDMVGQLSDGECVFAVEAKGTSDMLKGLAIWDYRMLDTDPIPDSIRYQVLMESGGRCALCGATKNERPLDVDHIKPRSKGGMTVRENLQVLCSKCNRSKGNKDDTDFREFKPADSDARCLFCGEEIRERIVEDLGSVFAV